MHKRANLHAIHKHVALIEYISATTNYDQDLNYVIELAFDFTL